MDAYFSIDSGLIALCDFIILLFLYLYQQHVILNKDFKSWSAEPLKQSSDSYISGLWPCVLVTV